MGAAIILAVAVLAFSARQSVAAPTGLVAAYGFNEGASTSVADSSGTGNNGTVRGAAWSNSGRFGKALSFTASAANHWVTVPDAAALRLTNGMTLEAWVNPNVLGTGGSSWRTVVFKERTGGNAYGLYANNGSARPVGQVYVGAAERNAAGTAQLPLNTWSHIATTYDGATLRFYLNGTQTSSLAIAGAITSSTGVLHIGGNAVWGEWFGGLIDEVRIYNRALAQTEIQSDMTTAVGTGPPADTTAPTAPSNFVRTGSTATTISTSWSASTDYVGVTGYALFVNGNAAGTTTSTTSTFGSLTCGTSYTLGVEAYDAAGNRSARTTLQTATSACADTTAPTTPTNLAAASVTQTSVTLGWTASTDSVGVTGYTLYRNGTSTGTVTGTSGTVSGLTCGTLYTLGVDAYDAAGNHSGRATLDVTTSACSDTTPPTTPANLAQTTVTQTSVTLGWTASTDSVGVTGYTLYRNGTSTGTVTGTSGTVSGLTCGTLYTLGVDAYDAAGNHSGRATLDVTTSACPTGGGLVAAYGFNEGTGTAVADASGTGNNGTTTSTTWSTAGRFGSALSFNGSSSWVTVPDAASLDLTTAMTLEAWVNPSSLGSSWRTAIFKEQPGDMVYSLYANNGSPQRPVGQVYVGGAERNAAGTAALPSNAWSHLAATYDGSTLKLYVNGTQVSTLSITGTMPVSSGVLHIGGNAVWGERFAGLIDEVRIYNRALTQAQVQTDMTTAIGGGPPADTTPPSAPASLAATGSAGGVSLQWTGSTDNVGVSRYTIHRGTTAGFTPSAGNQVGQSTTTSYGDGGLAAGTYYYRVRAEDAAGNLSQPSNEASAVVSGDTTPPTVTMTAPAEGSTLSGPVSLTADASDASGVGGVQFQVDGANLGAEDTSGPYSYVWNTATATNGTHALRAVARDTAGNVTVSAPVSVTVANTSTQDNPSPIPEAGTRGVTVGDGFIDASDHQIVRTANNVVYVITANDDGCQGNPSGKSVITARKGTGAQPGNAAVPTAFAEMDAANHPVSQGTGDCIFNGGVVLQSPDVRLDRSGIVHVVYIDGANHNLYYQTFSTITDTWGSRTVVGTDAQDTSSSGWPREGNAAITLDANDVPHVAYATRGASDEVEYVNRIGGVWSSPIVVANGTDIVHPSLTTALDGSLHLAWLNAAKAAHGSIGYARYSAGAWSAPELVSSGDSQVLSNENSDQGPSVASDTGGTPYVLYDDGTPRGPDNFVRLRYRTPGGTWTDNTPPGGLGGASNPNGMLFNHAPQVYISATNAVYAFLGHDVNIEFGYQYQLGGVGTTWSAYATLDPRSFGNPDPGDPAPGTDGSAVLRLDPLRDNNPGIIDALYFDEKDPSSTGGVDHHATIFYKAIVIQ